MMDRRLRRVGAVGTVAAIVTATAGLAQPAPTTSTPLRTTPKETFTVSAGFRDWAPAAIAGTTIGAGNSSNRGGLFAIDAASGKLKWTTRPAGLPRGNPFVATRPAIAGNVVIAPMAHTLVAVLLASGKEAWRGPQTAQGTGVAAGDGAVFVMGEDGAFLAIDAASGRERWRAAYSRSSCAAAPVFADGVVYVSAAIAADPSRPATAAAHVVALDAATGKERWRYASAPARGVCLDQPVVAGGTLFGTAESTLLAIDLVTGRDRWAPVEIRRPVEGRVRPVEMRGLVDAGSVLVGVTSNLLIAIDKATGRTAWEVPGQYRTSSPSTAVAGNVLYFQGHPGAEPAPEVQDRVVYSGGKPVPTAPVLPGGRLNALDLETRAILWSFSRQTAEPNWPFGFVLPVNGGVWVDSYQALVKLQ